MSKKTIKQRIAAVAATALGASVLTLVTIAPANATATLLRDDYTASTTQVLGENFGVCYVASGVLDNADATNTVEMLSTGTLRLSGTSTTNRDINDKLTFTVTGPGQILGWTGASSVATGTLNATGKSVVFTGTTTATNEAPTKVSIKPTGTGVIQVAITEYDASAATSHAIEIISITSVASCGNAVVATANTFMRLVDSTTVANAITYASGTSIDETDKNLAANDGSIYLRVDAYDSYGNAITETTTTLTVEVSAGAVVGVEAASSSIAQAFTTDKSTYFTVSQATEDVPWSGTITVKLDGVVLGTKTAKIVGAPKTIEVSGLDIAQQGAVSASTVGDYVIKDSAGNEVAVAVTGFTTLTEAQSKIITAGSSIRTPSQTTARAIAGTTKGVFQATCAASGAGATVTGLTLKYTDASLVTITSPAFSLTCGEAAYTYTASLDKASYVPGDIATLTISAKGQFGNPVHDAEVVGTNTLPISIAASNMTAVIAATNPDKFTAGVKTYKFIVGSTEGSYSMIVDLSAYNSSSKPQSAVTVPFKIAAGTATVSNADVLKSIVALIASINKQIQALQKLILQRR